MMHDRHHSAQSKEPVSDGLWTPDGSFSMADMDAFMVMALESLNPTELPE